MQWRRILYIILITLAVFYVLNNNESKSPPTPVIGKEQILADFQTVTEGSWLNFPVKYTGENGDMFYLGQNISDQPVTKAYRIYMSESGQLNYKVLDQWNNVKLPQNQFETYYLVSGKWLKQK